MVGGENHQRGGSGRGSASSERECAAELLAEHIKATGNGDGADAAGKELRERFAFGRGGCVEGDTARGNCGGNEQQGFRSLNGHQPATGVAEATEGAEVAGDGVGGKHAKDGAIGRCVALGKGDFEGAVECCGIGDLQRVIFTGRIATDVQPQHAAGRHIQRGCGEVADGIGCRSQ